MYLRQDADIMGVLSLHRLADAVTEVVQGDAFQLRPGRLLQPTSDVPERLHFPGVLDVKHLRAEQKKREGRNKRNEREEREEKGRRGRRR